MRNPPAAPPWILVSCLFLSPIGCGPGPEELAEVAQAATAGRARFTIAAGERLVFRARGTGYERLARSRPLILTSRGAQVSSSLAVSLSAFSTGGRWVDVRATSTARAGTHLLEGLPVEIEVVAGGSSTRTSAQTMKLPPRDQILFASAVDGAHAGIAFRGPYRPMTTTVITTKPGGEALIPIFHDDGTVTYGWPGSGGVDILDVPDIQVFELVPESGALVGGTLEIVGQALPWTSCQVRLGSTTLALISASSSKIVVQLPSTAQSGELRLVRTTDGASAVLAPNYEVSTEPRAFTFFEAEESGQSWTNAYLLMLLSSLAYQDEDHVEAQADAWGLSMAGPMIDEVTPLFYDTDGSDPTGSTQAAVLYNDDAVIVAFRGSTTADLAQDWIDNDLDLSLIDKSEWGAGVRVHHGFDEAMEIAYQDVLEQIEPLLEGRRLWLTGHSLGGALAVLTAYRLAHEDGIDVEGVHVFGAPAVGTSQFAGVYDNQVPNTYRWNVEQDPVPVLLPPPSYTHVGIRNNLYADGSEVLDDALVLYYVPVAPLLAAFAWNLAVTHNSYLPRLREALVEHEPETAEVLPPPPGS